MKQALSVLAAIGLVLALAVSLVARVSARSTVRRPPVEARAGSVAPPRPIVVSELPTPYCWGCSWNRNAPLEFQLDLDLLAPLGDGPDNAAEWFAQFAKHERAPSSPSPHERRETVTVDGVDWFVFPGDDPLLLEAEAWVDQSTMSFYPEVWPIRGMETAIPNLLLMIDLSRSWVVRGKLSGDVEDFRRAIRLGRLLRQDDATLIQDLVAIACIRIGAEAIYVRAREQGDAATMLVASLVLADKDAMRQMTAQRITTLERAFRVEDAEADRLELTLSDGELEAIVELLGEVTERRFRMEGLIGMHAVRHLGTPAQQERARAVLLEYADSDDELTAGLARHYLDAPFDAEQLREMLLGGE